MKRDIETREDIERMLKAFYEKVFRDELIRHFFTEVIPLDVKHHIPLIADFWESVLFHKHTYRRNVMEIHLAIHRLSPVQKVHLDRWVHLFTETVNEFFEGEKARLASQRAFSIAALMNLKMNHPHPFRDV